MATEVIPAPTTPPVAASSSRAAEQLARDRELFAQFEAAGFGSSSGSGCTGGTCCGPG
ncbi:hypothetical protein [Streptomyces sp. NPDC058424]|uniref:hypothetical protein n=1 Tax=Streptomyces sp. NPDC058424 TaxID=3346491 RepID=UPI00365073D5